VSHQQAEAYIEQMYVHARIDDGIITAAAVSPLNYGAPADRFQLPSKLLNDWTVRYG
jgi:hypothetical protein